MNGYLSSISIQHDKFVSSESISAHWTLGLRHADVYCSLDSMIDEDYHREEGVLDYDEAVDMVIQSG